MLSINDNVLEKLRCDLGRGRADRLVRDAMLGSDAAILRLERVAGVNSYIRKYESILSVSWKIAPHTFWYGDLLIVPGALPDVVVSAAPGMHLSELVGGSTIGDAVIEGVGVNRPAVVSSESHTRTSTAIRVKANSVSFHDIPLGRIGTWLQPVRLAIDSIILAWKGQPDERLDMPIYDSLPCTLGVIMVLAIFIVVWLSAMAASFVIRRLASWVFGSPGGLRSTSIPWNEVPSGAT